MKLLGSKELILNLASSPNHASHCEFPTLLGGSLAYTHGAVLASCSVCGERHTISMKQSSCDLQFVSHLRPAAPSLMTSHWLTLAAGYQLDWFDDVTNINTNYAIPRTAVTTSHEF